MLGGQDPLVQLLEVADGTNIDTSNLGNRVIVTELKDYIRVIYPYPRIRLFFTWVWNDEDYVDIGVMCQRTRFELVSRYGEAVWTEWKIDRQGEHRNLLLDHHEGSYPWFDRSKVQRIYKSDGVPAMAMIEDQVVSDYLLPKRLEAGVDHLSEFIFRGFTGILPVAWPSNKEGPVILGMKQRLHVERVAFDPQQPIGERFTISADGIQFTSDNSARVYSLGQEQLLQMIRAGEGTGSYRRRLQLFREESGSTRVVFPPVGFARILKQFPPPEPIVEFSESDESIEEES